MSKMYSITGFNYLELTIEAKRRVLSWLDECPFEYETEEGNIMFDYASEWDEADIVEHCQINGYIFDKWGNPIHNLIEG